MEHVGGNFRQKHSMSWAFPADVYAMEGQHWSNIRHDFPSTNFGAK